MSSDTHIDELIGRYLDGMANEAELNSLQEALRAQPEAADAFADIARFEAMLHVHVAREASGAKWADDGRLTVDELPSGAGIAVDMQAGYHASFNVPPSWATTSLVGSVAFSYLMAAIIMGAALTAAWVWKLPEQAQMAGISTPSGSRAPRPESWAKVVGQVTGMVDCQWADTNTATLDRASVLLGRKYAIRSGWMEITYNTGAKVLLEGPCTYAVDSPVGGFLSVGKLVARVESRVESTNQQPLNPNFQIPNPSRLFAIRTPTATVTDLGTEFGVDVDERGETTSHVFRGSIRVQAMTEGGMPNGEPRIVQANESVRVGRGADRTIADTAGSIERKFVRSLAERKTKQVDLVDIVAGGDGFSGRRNMGIDPATGRMADTPYLPRTTPTSRDNLIAGDGKYHRVDRSVFVDGVFVPDGSSPMQIDSAGHIFDGFPGTSNITGIRIWAGGELPAPPVPDDIPSAWLGGVNYGTGAHGILYMHANNGITFDMDAIRRANTGRNIVRFVANVGNTEPGTGQGDVAADVWVLVDGQPRFKRREINRYNGVAPVSIVVHDGDRFLTLASTDSGGNITKDWIVFGDPRLELSPVRSEDNGSHPAER